MKKKYKKSMFGTIEIDVRKQIGLGMSQKRIVIGTFQLEKYQSFPIIPTTKMQPFCSS